MFKKVKHGEIPKYSTIASTSDYLKYLDSKKDVSYKINPYVRNFISSALNPNIDRNGPNGKLKLFLNKLPENTKVELIRALILSDGDKIASILSKPLTDKMSAIGIENLRHIALHQDKEKSGNNPSWLNAEVVAIIRATLHDPDGNVLSIEDKERILGASFKGVPDTLIDIRSKVAMVKSIDSNLSELRLAYSEAIKDRKDSIGSGDVSLKAFKAATKHNKIDESQFIILALGLLQVSARPSELRPFVISIRNHYLNGDYKAAIHNIEKCMDPAKKIIDQEVINALSNAKKSLKPVDRAKNYARRFLENRLIAFRQNEFNGYDSVNEIAKRFLPATNVNNSQEVIKLMSDLNEIDDEAMVRRGNELKEESYSWKGRGKGKYKTGIVSKLDEAGGKQGDSVFSSNRGSMTSNQPNFRDELTDNPIRNASVDTNTLIQTAAYIANSPNAVNVSSLSGHAYSMVALLERYMENYRSDPSLQNNIQNFVSIYVTAYASQGFHSLSEMIDVFKEPEVKDIFDRFNVKLDFSFSDAVMELAFRDAQEYTRNLSLSQSVQEDLSSRNSLPGAILSSEVKNVQAVAHNSTSLFGAKKAVDAMFETSMLRAATQLGNIDLAHLSDRDGLNNTVNALEDMLIDLSQGLRRNGWQNETNNLINNIQSHWKDAEEDKHDKLHNVLESIKTEITKLEHSEQDIPGQSRMDR